MMILFYALSNCILLDHSVVIPTVDRPSLQNIISNVSTRGRDLKVEDELALLNVWLQYSVSAFTMRLVPSLY